METSKTTAGKIETTITRLGQLETTLATVANQFGDFIKDSHEHRKRLEQDQANIWKAVKEQGDKFTAAVDRMSTRGALSWPVVVLTIGMILGLITSIAVIAEKIADARLQQQIIRMDYMEQISQLKHTHTRDLLKQSANP